jgi:N-acetylmuramic acid 6-phosphate etherase
MVDLQVTCTKLQDRGERILMELLHVERVRATELLSGSEGSVKTALVMGSAEVTAAEARERLDRAGGRVAAALGEAR